ncbi:MAG: family N-acetyltransferase [Novosphingobium sp.]|nr:family N-acetyltransferase [Novosphingobium sp.]
MFIRSERLFLRPGWPEDWAELMTRIGDEAVGRQLSRSPWPYTPAAAREYLKPPGETGGDPRCPQFLVTLPTCDGSQLIGCAGLASSADGVELGFWVARERWGQGYATEAARAVLSLARTLGHRRIVASHFADNAASGNVLRKVGFSPTGETRLRFCPARGAELPALTYALALDEACACDDDDMGNASRAA